MRQANDDACQPVLAWRRCVARRYECLRITAGAAGRVAHLPGLPEFGPDGFPPVLHAAPMPLTVANVLAACPCRNSIRPPRLRVDACPPDRHPSGSLARRSPRPRMLRWKLCSGQRPPAASYTRVHASASEELSSARAEATVIGSQLPGNPPGPAARRVGRTIAAPGELFVVAPARCSGTSSISMMASKTHFRFGACRSAHRRPWRQF